MSTTFKGKIKVASRIVDHLSSGLYESPSACLKELINNSYDADASVVNVFIKPEADRIIIEDNGHGLNEAEFKKHFSSVSESYKRVENDETEIYQRKKIGKIGIGFIAANEICDVMEIISTKKGSKEELNVVINFSEIRKDPATREKSKDGSLEKGDYEGSVKQCSKEEHYTYIFLKNIRGDARNILSGAGVSKFSGGNISLYGKTHKSICEVLKANKVKSWSVFDSYSRNMLEIGLNVPVKYHDNWMPNYLSKNLLYIEKKVEKLNFKLFIDGTEIRKPIVYSPTKNKNQSFVKSFEFNGNNVSAVGYFYAQDTGIKPEELQGVLTRIRCSSIGGYDTSFFGFSSSSNPLLQSWVSGEIYVDDRLERAMNIDRKTLRITHPSYVELQKYIHEYVDGILKEVRSKIYGAGTKERKKKKANEVAKNVKKITKKHSKILNKSTKDYLNNSWSDRKTLQQQKITLKKYTIDELYEVVIETASELLTKEQLSEFITKLTERLK